MSHIIIVESGSPIYNNTIEIQEGLETLTPNIVSEQTVYTIELVNTEKILVSDLPDNIPASKISGVVTSVSGNITLGTTVIPIDGSSSVIDGLTRISGVSSNNPVYLYNVYISGGTP